MRLHARVLDDLHGGRTYVIYREGQFSTPIALLDQHEAEQFCMELDDVIGELPPHPKPTTSEFAINKATERAKRRKHKHSS